LVANAFVFQARLKRAELQRDRARAAFVAAKLRQQGKIKSRRYESLLLISCIETVIFNVLCKNKILNCAMSKK